MAIPSYFKRLFREYVTGVGSSEVADQAPVQSSSDVDHDSTSNRTHDGDDLTPATLEATDTLTGPAGNSTTDITTLGGKVYFQETEPSDTPSPPPDGSGGVWYPKTEIGTGATQSWSDLSGESIRTGIAIASETAVFGTDGDAIYGYDINDGTQLWSRSTSYASESGVAISNGTVIIGHAVGSNDPFLYGLNLSDGTQEWEFDPIDAVTSGIAISNGTAVFGNSADKVFAVSVSDGTKQWDFSTGGGGNSSGVAIDSGTVAIGSDDKFVYGLALSDGTQQWSFDAGGAVQSGIVIENDVVVAGNRIGDLYGLALSDGSKQWEYDAGSDEDIYDIVSRDGSAFFGDDANFATRIDVSNGDVQWTYEADLPVKEVVLTDNEFFGASFDHTFALSPDTGDLLYEIDPTDQYFSTPLTVDDNTIVTGSNIGIEAFTQSTNSLYDTPQVSDGNNWIEKL